MDENTDKTTYILEDNIICYMMRIPTKRHIFWKTILYDENTDKTTYILEDNIIIFILFPDMHSLLILDLL